MTLSKEEDRERKRAAREREQRISKKKLEEQLRIQRLQLLPSIIATVTMAHPDQSIDAAVELIGLKFADDAQRDFICDRAMTMIKERSEGGEIEHMSRVVRASISALVQMTFAAAAAGQIPPRDFPNAALKLSLLAKNYLPDANESIDEGDLVEVEGVDDTELDEMQASIDKFDEEADDPYD